MNRESSLLLTAFVSILVVLAFSSPNNLGYLPGRPSFVSKTQEKDIPYYPFIAPSPLTNSPSLYLHPISESETIKKTGLRNIEKVWASPDLKSSVYVTGSINDSGRYLSNLFLLKHNNLSSRSIISGAGSLMQEVKWSPDSQKFVFSTLEGATFEEDGTTTWYLYDSNNLLEKLDIDSKNNVVGFAGPDKLLLTADDVSSRGQKIGFYYLSTKTSDFPLSQEQFVFGDLQFSLSAEGDKWSFHRNNNALNGAGKVEIIVTKTGERNGLSVDSGRWAEIQGSVISPDGTRVVYEKRLSGQFDVGIMFYDLISGQRRQLARGHLGPKRWIDNDKFVINMYELGGTFSPAKTIIVDVLSGLNQVIDHYALAKTVEPETVPSGISTTQVIYAHENHEQSPKPENDSNLLEEYVIKNFNPATKTHRVLGIIPNNFFTERLQFSNNKIFFISPAGELKNFDLESKQISTVPIPGIVPTDKYLNPNSVVDMMVKGDLIAYQKGECEESLTQCSFHEFDLKKQTDRVIFDDIAEKIKSRLFNGLRLIDYDPAKNHARISQAGGDAGWSYQSIYDLSLSTGQVSLIRSCDSFNGKWNCSPREDIEESDIRKCGEDEIIVDTNQRFHLKREPNESYFGQFLACI
ncbi:MAG: hypothetical protein AAB455_01850 [Patescibacteria group bacterium]